MLSSRQYWKITQLYLYGSNLSLLLGVQCILVISWCLENSFLENRYQLSVNEIQKPSIRLICHQVNHCVLPFLYLVQCVTVFIQQLFLIYDSTSLLISNNIIGHNISDLFLYHCFIWYSAYQHGTINNIYKPYFLIS